MFNAIAIARAAQLQGDNILDTNDAANDSPLRKFFRRIGRYLNSPGETSRSLFIFSEENIVRKYARMIIEWGYPF
jgi:hypothetical protein